jgi:hypothetical protein
VYASEKSYLEGKCVLMMPMLLKFSARPVQINLSLFAANVRERARVEISDGVKRMKNGRPRKHIFRVILGMQR